MKTIKIIVDGKEIEATISEQDAKELTAEKPWPQEGDEYWIVNDAGVVVDSHYIDSWIDSQRISMGNMFRSREDALNYLRARKLTVAVNRRRRELNGDWRPDWNNRFNRKHYLMFDNQSHCFDWLYSSSDISSPAFGYFQKSSDVLTVAKEFEDELIWYFTEYLPSLEG